MMHISVPDPSLITTPVRLWAQQWRRLRAHPLVDPESPPFSRAGVAMFALMCVAGLALLAALAEQGALVDPRIWVFVALVTLTELAEIELGPGRLAVVNDAFYLVPFVFLPLPDAAMLLLLAAIADVILHPRPLVRAMARLSSSLLMRLATLGAVVLMRQFVEADSSAGIALLVAAGLTGARIGDYLLFPATIKVAIGRSYSWTTHVREQARLDAIVLAIELPLALVAAFAFSREWLSLIALVIPYAALWRLTLLRPRVDALEKADELKSQFLSMASHELRTPLTSILGFAHTLEHRWRELPEEDKLEFIGVIGRQSARLARLVDDLLTMSRIEAGAVVPRAQPIPLRQMIERAIAQFDTMQLSCACPGTLQVCADPDHLEQILINYVSNALKYGEPPYSLTVNEEGSDVTIRMSDRGPGVPAEFVPQLFERFSQARDGSRRATQGTGLGLSIVRELARLQGGEAWYERNGDCGSTFAVRLPRG